MQALHKLLAQTLAAQIKNGGVDENGNAIPPAPALLSVARQFLKDNHIEATRDNPDVQALKKLTDELPFSSFDEHGLPN